MDTISHLHVEYKEALQPLIRQRLHSGDHCWLPPQPDSLKINVDASVKKETGKFGVGVVVRNASGILMGAPAEPFEASWSVKHAELIAIREALRFCIDMGFHQGEIVIDCREALQAVNSLPMNTQLDPDYFLVESLQEIFSLHSGFIGSFASREANRVAQCIAQYATGLTHYESWLEVGPQWHTTVLQADICNSSL
ncbi:uncharacterized protein LOC132804961 [Ziziphus jujuba]|uniref:Uncharacterized protein LOC132804961 n=1 Tax=Ziziphus jujuba TaxID=326968 RepID=A0ABM4AFE5_ZIZJJ|nr:uncharacterized protein LOC132804961 [Ziziphus jujuba]